MDVKEIKKTIRHQIGFGFVNESHVTQDSLASRAKSILDQLRRDRKVSLDDATQEEIVKALCDDFLGFGPLQPLMEDEKITEIMVNGPSKIFIEKEGRKTLSDISFDDEHHLRYIIEKMLGPTGRRVDESFPYVDFSLEEGSRVNVIIPPLVVGGAVVTIRKFLRSIQKLDDLVSLGTLNQPMADFLEACVKAKMNILFSGATGSGKTTSLEVLASYLDPAERIITIEDALELHLPQEHAVRLLTKPANIEGKGDISLRELFRNTLRMRPTRIILGEIRGEEAMDYLQALNSGHRGCMAVIHASTPSDTLTRLETMALYAGLNIPSWAVRQQISSGLDLIVQQERLNDGSRKVTYITEVGSCSNNAVVLRDIFRFEREMVDEAGNVKGTFKALSKPSFLDAFHKKGIKLSESIFSE